MKSHVGSDFVDAKGVRLFSFQLCKTSPKTGRFESHASLCFEDGKLTRALFTPATAPRAAAIERLARVWMGRSVPVVFRETVLPR